MILSKHMGLLQEGALHSIHFAPTPEEEEAKRKLHPAPPPDSAQALAQERQREELAALPFGWRFAVVEVPRQESRVRMVRVWGELSGGRDLGFKQSLCEAAKALVVWGEGCVLPMVRLWGELSGGRDLNPHPTPAGP